MDHVALARIAFKQLKSEPQQAGVDVAQIKRWLEETTAAPHAVLGEVRDNLATNRPRPRVRGCRFAPKSPSRTTN